MMALPDAFDDFLQKLVWVAWNDEEGRKVPKSPSGGNAKSNDPASWGTYGAALKAVQEKGYSGVGLMLSDGLVGIDLDGAIDSDGSIRTWAQEIIDEIGSYAEKSPSGEGVHILTQADIGEVGAIGRADHRSGIEIYNHGRYFTVTGDRVNLAGIVDRTKEIARFVSNRFSGESPEDRMRKAVGRMASDQVRRRANETTLANAKRDDRRFARKIGSGETCTFCMMLASRGFVYYSEDTAGKHWHNNCKCEVVPGFKGMEIEGLDFDELYDRWHLFLEADADRSLTNAQRSAMKKYLLDLPADKGSLPIAKARAVADSYGEQIDDAWKKFRKIKTEENYEATVGAELAKIGKQAGIELTGEFMARPNGDEIWSAIQSAKQEAKMLYATREHKALDAEIDEMLVEIKTIESPRKLPKRLMDAAAKFDSYPNEPRKCIVSLLRFDGDDTELIKIVNRFVDDGTFDSIDIVKP